MLGEKLPQYLTYHSINHVHDVLHSAIDLAEQEGVNGDDLILIKTAILFHDSGFLEEPKNHEERSCKIARHYLPEYEYSEGQIKKICGMIMATHIPQTPTNHLEEIVADADLDYLGRVDFLTISDYLYEEMLYFGMVSNRDEWNRIQVKFLEHHHYFTSTALKTRKPKKMEHLQAIKSKLKS